MRFLPVCTIFAILLVPGASMPQTLPVPAPSSSQDANLINIFFTVHDRNGSLVSGLTRDDFEVLEDGKPQLIRSFSAESSLPMTLGLLIDSSGSVTDMLDKAKPEAADFLAQVMRPQDIAFVASFDTNVVMLQDLTSDTGLLRKGLKKASINAGGVPVQSGPSPTRSTALYNAIWGTSRAISLHRRRKALVILTDGQDQGSIYTLKEAIEKAQMADVGCYVVLWNQAKNTRARNAMAQLAKATGGRMIEVEKLNKLNDAFTSLASELRSTYMISYSPENKVRDGAFHAIELNHKGHYKVAARNGYYALTSEQVAAATPPVATKDKNAKKK